MSRLRVLLFHRLEVWLDERKISIEVRRARELLAFLVLYRGLPHRRDALVSRIWGEDEIGQARSNLRRTLWQLQTALDDSQASPKHILIEGDWIQLNPCAAYCADVVTLEECFAHVRGKQGPQLHESEADCMRSAVDLYRGELLEGWPQNWCLYERQRFQFMYMAMLDKLVDYCETRQQYEEGITYALRLLHHDRAREPTHRQLMRLYCLCGNLSAALQQYEDCADFLRAELDMAPSAVTTALYEQVRSNRIPALPAVGLATEQIETAQLTDLLEEMTRLQYRLATMQHQMDQQITALRETIDATAIPQ